MSFAENLKKVRKEKNITQEQLADLLDVSRQAISKWESGYGYPETEKLVLISKKLEVSLDYLLLDEDIADKEKATEQKKIIAPTGKIAIYNYDGSTMVTCHAVKTSPIAFPGKGEPKFLLLGIDKVTFWGEHTVILGWYQSSDDTVREIEEIAAAMERGEATYQLKYAADIELKGFFGKPRLRNPK